MYVRLLLGLLCVFWSAHLADASPFAYIGNYSGSGRVSAIDLNTSNISNIALPGAMTPYGVAVNAFGSRVYVTDRTNAKVFVIDTATNAVSSITLANIPSGLAVNAAGTRLYVANLNGTVSMLDPATGTVLDTENAQNDPEGVAVITNGSGVDQVYVANRGSHSVSIYNASGSAITKVTDLDIGQSSPTGIAVNPVLSKNRVYVANSDNSSVTVIDTSNNTKVTDIAVGAFPFGVAVAPNGLKAYVTLSGASDSVAVIDTNTNSVIGAEAVNVGQVPMGISITNDGAKVVAVNNQGQSASVVTLPGTVSTLALTGTNPQSFGKFIGPEFVAVTLNAGDFGRITPKDPISIDPATKKILVPKGSNVGLNVTPDTNFSIGTVTLDGATFPYPYTITNPTSDKVVAATFVRNGYNVTVSKTGSGTVTATGINCGSTCSANYSLNTQVVFTADADPGYLFIGWQGAACTGTLFCSITTDGNYADVSGVYSLLATFKKYDDLQTMYTYAPGDTTINTGVSYTLEPSSSFTANVNKAITLKPASPSTTLNLPSGTTSGVFTVAGNSSSKITISGGGTFIIQ